MRNILIALTLTVATLLQGCGVTVSAREQDLFRRNAENATQMADVAERDTNVPDAYKRWIRADAKTWKALHKWSLGERASDAKGE